MILFRTHKFDANTRAFCERLQNEAGQPLACLVDETTRELDVAPFSKISLTPRAFREQGLLVTRDAAWRCGDYGLYVAAATYPDVPSFWLVEYDVRIRASGALAEFFQSFDGSQSDLIATYMSQRSYDWWWYPSMQSRSQPVWGCLFGLLRVSAPLLAAAAQDRRRRAKSLLDRVFWPNDESFLATTAVRRGFSVEDLNHRRTWYTPSTFAFEKAWSGAELADSEADDLVYHAVLFDEDFARKQARSAKPTAFLERAQRKARKTLGDIF